jgi:hypothetical protein
VDARFVQRHARLLQKNQLCSLVNLALNVALILLLSFPQLCFLQQPDIFKFLTPLLLPLMLFHRFKALITSFLLLLMLLLLIMLLQFSYLFLLEALLQQVELFLAFSQLLLLHGGLQVVFSLL